MADEQAHQTNPEPSAASTLTFPASWPGGFGAYKYSKQAVKLNLGIIVSFALISGILDGATSLGIKNKPLANLINFLLSSLFTAIVVPVLLASIRQKKLGFGKAVNTGIKFWLPILVLNILMSLTIVISLILLVIPFFFVWPRLALANYFLVDKNIGPIEAYKASWQATKGNVGFIYGIFGVELAMGLLAITIIGIPFAVYFLIMYSAAHALLYELVTSQPNPASTTTPPASTLSPTAS